MACSFVPSLSLTQVSGSMQGEKITQLQDAMFTILDQMTEDDYFSILTFNYAVQVGFKSSHTDLTQISKFSDLDV